MGANKKIEVLSDVSRHGFELGIGCYCGHRSTLHAVNTVRYFQCRCWSTRAFQCLRHFRCTRCGRKGRVRIGLSAGVPVDHGVYPRSEDGWKALVKRLRG
jgi:hypothetical protein